MADVLAKMADGTLAIHLKQEYTGDFSRIKDALLNISASMTEIMTGISESSNQVSAGSDDLAKAAQTLAEGATTQAASVEDTCFEALVKSFGKRDIRVCRVAPDYKLEAVAVITGLMHT